MTNGRSVVLQVPFYENRDTEIWLHKLEEHDIPLWATHRMISQLSEKEQLRLLSEQENVLPFSFDGDLQKDLAHIQLHPGYIKSVKYERYLIMKGVSS